MPANDVTQVADDHLRDLAELDPYAAQALGRTPSSLLPDLSPDVFAGRLASDVALYEVGFIAVSSSRSTPGEGAGRVRISSAMVASSGRSRTWMRSAAWPSSAVRPAK
ncbi:hypothetical protein [Jiangella muralis]|uniref:hypothetical protein n=1 Tax=Jiangella muralis TaxID=702383 RepID=UPI00069F12E8|nr:hypothetical protein [Jiangella muralis]